MLTNKKSRLVSGLSEFFVFYNFNKPLVQAPMKTQKNNKNKSGYWSCLFNNVAKKDEKVLLRNF